MKHRKIVLGRLSFEKKKIFSYNILLIPWFLRYLCLIIAGLLILNFGVNPKGFLVFISIFSVLSIIIPETEYIVLNGRLIVVSKRVFNLFKGVDTIRFSEIDKLEYLPEESTSTIIILTTGLGGVYSQARIKIMFKSGEVRTIRARGSRKTIIELCNEVNELIALDGK